MVEVKQVVEENQRRQNAERRNVIREALKKNRDTTEKRKKSGKNLKSMTETKRFRGKLQSTLKDIQSEANRIRGIPVAAPEDTMVQKTIYNHLKKIESELSNGIIQYDEIMKKAILIVKKVEENAKKLEADKKAMEKEMAVLKGDVDPGEIAFTPRADEPDLIEQIKDTFNL